MSGLWGTGNTWAAGPLWGTGSIPGVVIVPGVTQVSATRFLFETSTFLCESVKTNWDPAMTEGFRPTILPEEKKRRVSFLTQDTITCRPDYRVEEPVALSYQWKNEEQFITFRIWTRVSKEHAMLVTNELERCLDFIRTDSFGSYGADTGRNWLQIVQVTEAEKLTRKYWYREMMVKMNRRYRAIGAS